MGISIKYIYDRARERKVVEHSEQTNCGPDVRTSNAVHAGKQHRVLDLEHVKDWGGDGLHFGRHGGIYCVDKGGGRSGSPHKG